MATAPIDENDDLFARFLEGRGHEIEETWDRSYNKKQCPECGGLHDLAASYCSVCGWGNTPAAEQNAD